MMDPAPVQIELPDIALFWGENGSTKGCSGFRLGGGWMMDTNKNSQFLVRACRSEMQPPQAKCFMDMMGSREDYVLVFSGFDDPKYLHRITTTTYQSSGFHGFGISLTVVGENENAKTLLLVDCEELEFNELEEDKETRVFDLETGQALFTRRYGEFTKFVCSRYSLRGLDEDDYCGVSRLMWINWNGKELTICEKDVPLPISGEETRLQSVTDTRILFAVVGHKGTYHISYDYILADKSDKHLINSDKSTWKENFIKEDYKSSDEEEDDE